MPKGHKADLNATINKTEFDFHKYKEIEEDYLTAAIWCEDDECTGDELYALKKVIASLTLPERRILIAYAECGTYAETARLFGVNSKTVKNYITKLRQKIFERIYD